jgi:Peptidase M16 inactive domain
VSLFDRLPAGWFVVNVTSTPQKIHEAMNASLRVLRNVAALRISPREIMRAKRTLITRHESDLKVRARRRRPPVRRRSASRIGQLHPIGFSAACTEACAWSRGLWPVGGGGARRRRPGGAVAARAVGAQVSEGMN